MKLRKNPALLNANVSVPATRPAPIPAPRPEPLVIPPAPNKPDLFGDRIPILNVSAVRQPFVNGKMPGARVK